MDDAAAEAWDLLPPPLDDAPVVVASSRWAPALCVSEKASTNATTLLPWE